jgi:ATP-binding cassette subfamily F protein 3
MAAWGSNVELGIFSQDSADLSPGRNLLAELRDVEPGISDGDARSYLARFGFSGDVMKDVGALSGGERSRLSLAKIFRRRPNVLVLDEPTNHLDIYAREALEQFLSAYEGTIVMVTHDRALLERLCKRLVVFEREDSGGHEAVFFRGDYEQYVGWREAQHIDVGATRASPETRLGGTTTGDARVAPTNGLPSLHELVELARQQRTSVEGYCRKQAERERRRAAEIEQRIEEIEQRSAELLQQQRDADAAGKYAEIGKLQEELDTLEHELERAFDELHEVEERAASWEELSNSAIG